VRGQPAPSSPPPDPFDSPAVAESVADSLGVVREADPNFLRLWGYDDLREVVGKPVLHFMKDKERASHIFGWLERVGSWEGCFDAETRRRRVVRVRARLRVLRDASGHRTGFQGRFVEDKGCDEAAPIGRS
jgi:PAS domain-containing protein